MPLKRAKQEIKTTVPFVNNFNIVTSDSIYSTCTYKTDSEINLFDADSTLYYKSSMTLFENLISEGKKQTTRFPYKGIISLPEEIVLSRLTVMEIVKDYFYFLDSRYNQLVIADKVLNDFRTEDFEDFNYEKTYFELTGDTTSFYYFNTYQELMAMLGKSKLKLHSMDACGDSLYLLASLPVVSFVEEFRARVEDEYFILVYHNQELLVPIRTIMMNDAPYGLSGKIVCRHDSLLIQTMPTIENEVIKELNFMASFNQKGLNWSASNVMPIELPEVYRINDNPYDQFHPFVEDDFVFFNASLDFIHLSDFSTQKLDLGFDHVENLKLGNDFQIRDVKVRKIFATLLISDKRNSENKLLIYNLKDNKLMANIPLLLDEADLGELLNIRLLDNFTYCCIYDNGIVFNTIDLLSANYL